MKFTETKSSGTNLHDFVERLTSSDVNIIQGAINFPSGLSEDTTPLKFILRIKDWRNYKKYPFFQALASVNKSLVPLAEKIPFLATDAIALEDSVEQMMELFIHDLIDELTIDRWRLLLANRGYSVRNKKNYSDILKFCLKNEVIEKDLENLKVCFEENRRNALAQKMKDYANSFSQLSAADFSRKFYDILEKIQEN